MNKKLPKFAVIIAPTSDAATLLSALRYTQRYDPATLAVFCSKLDWSTPHYIQIEALLAHPNDAHAAQQYQTILLPSHSVAAVLQLQDDQLPALGFLPVNPS